MKIDTAVVLTGGPGTRLKPLTNDFPKGMVEICGKPLLQWIIEWLQAEGVRNVILGVAHLKEKIIEYFGNGARFGLNISYSVHSVEGGTSEWISTRKTFRQKIFVGTIMAMNYYCLKFFDGILSLSPNTTKLLKEQGWYTGYIRTVGTPLEEIKL